MKTIEVDEQLYRYIASRTLHIGESASDILRRLLALPTEHPVAAPAVDDCQVQSIADGFSPEELLKQHLDEAQIAKEESAIARFMLILTALYRVQPEAFSQAADIKGRKRIYFSQDAQALLENGKTTKPKQVPETPYWVITNTNTGRKRLILDQLMQAMGYSADTIAEVCNKV